MKNIGRDKADNARGFVAIGKDSQAISSSWVRGHSTEYPVILNIPLPLQSDREVAEVIRTKFFNEFENKIQRGISQSVCIFYTLEGSNEAFVPSDILVPLPIPFTLSFRVKVGADNFHTKSGLFKGECAVGAWDNIGVSP